MAIKKPRIVFTNSYKRTEQLYGKACYGYGYLSNNIVGNFCIW